MKKDDTQKIADVVEKHIREIEALHKVKQYGIGFAERGGKLVRDEMAIVFYVRHKPKVNQLHQIGATPIPAEIEGIPTDVVWKPYGFAKQLLTLQLVTPDDLRHRPLAGGVAAINAKENGTGTLGLIIKKKSGDISGNLYGITNNHVGASESTTANPTATKGDPWVQPGAHGHPPGHPPEDTIATLDDWKDMIPSGMGDNFYDYSLGKITDKSQARANEIMEVGRVEGMTDVLPGDRVIKRGRTTRKTVGEVIRRKIRASVAYQENTVCNFADQIEIMGAPHTTPFSGPGDSGSIVVTEESPQRVIGLLFAGGPDNEGVMTTIVSPIKRISDEHNLEF